MSDINKISDDALDSVSGGAGKTKWGFDYDDNGTVDFKGLKISAADWKWLMTQYKGNINDPEYYLSTVPAHDVDIILNEHHEGKR